MKSKAIIIISATLLLFVLSNSAFGVISNHSFRMKGIGTELIDFTKDEYSNIYYNPGYLDEIEGKRLYSNLSNLNGVTPASFGATDVNLLRNSLYPTNLIGGVGNLGATKICALYASSGLSIKGKWEFSSTEEKMVEPVPWDTLTVMKSAPVYESETVESNIGFGGKDFNLIWSSGSLGILLEVSTLSAGYSHDYEETKDATSWQNDTTSWKRNTIEKDEFEIKNSNYFFGLTIGKVFRTDTREISTTLGLKPTIVKFDLNNLDEDFSRSLQFGKWSQMTDKWANTDKDKEELTMSLSGWSGFLNFRDRAETGDDKYSSKMLGLSICYIPFSIDIKDFSRFEAWSNHPDSLYYRYRFSETHNDDHIEGSAIVFNTTIGYGRELSFQTRNAKLIYGGKFKFFYISGSGEDDPDIETETFIDIYPNDPERPQNGYRWKLESRNKREISANVGLLMLNFPVGIEVDVFPNLQFRLGSNAVFPVYFFGNAEYKTEDHPDWSEIQYTHGDSAGIWIGQSEDDNRTYKSTDKLTFSSGNFNLHSYSMGLGWKITDELQLDILHFSRLTDLGSWWLSLGIKLD